MSMRGTSRRAVKRPVIIMAALLAFLLGL